MVQVWAQGLAVIVSARPVERGFPIFQEAPVLVSAALNAVLQWLVPSIAKQV